MIDIQKIFEELNQVDSFKKIKSKGSPVSIFCGIREANLPSVAFMTQNPPLVIESTQYLKVSQWEEKEEVYWSSFDLQLMNARTIFYALCMDLIKAADGTKNDSEAMIAIKNRYMIWRKMFRKATSPMSLEEYQGLFGELYFLYFRLIKLVGVDNAINSWSGSSRTAKDFSINEDWYEVKTITSSAHEVEISSLTQLESDNVGRLIVVRVEKMSEEYNDSHSTVEELISLILEQTDDEEIKEKFIEKVTLYGYVAEIDTQQFPRFKVNSVYNYRVENDFPKIASKDIPYDEITQITYSISINGINRFLEVDDVNN